MAGITMGETLEGTLSGETTQRPSLINAELTELEKGINALGSKITRLEKDLTPVLDKRKPPQQIPDKEEEREQLPVPLAERILESREKIGDLNRRIETLTDQIEL